LFRELEDQTKKNPAGDCNPAGFLRNAELSEKSD
jgi:hypothetical protein